MESQGVQVSQTSNDIPEVFTDWFVSVDASICWCVYGITCHMLNIDFSNPGWGCSSCKNCCTERERDPSKTLYRSRSYWFHAAYIVGIRLFCWYLWLFHELLDHYHWESNEVHVTQGEHWLVDAKWWNYWRWICYVKHIESNKIYLRISDINHRRGFRCVRGIPCGPLVVQVNPQTTLYL